MKIREVTEPQPTPDDIAEVETLLGTIDPTTEQPQSLLGKLTGWIREYPLLDRITDLLPQTRMVKAIANAVDALEANNKQQALTSLAGALTGSAARVAGTITRGVNTAQALQQGDLKAAAMAQGGNVAKLARAGSTVNALQQKLAPAPQQSAEQDPTELDRIKTLANV